MTKPIRPPALDAPRPPPKPSSAPAPRLRPNAPFTRAGDPEFSLRASDAPLSAADDLAGALSPVASSQPAFFEAADSASLADAVVHAPSRRPLPAGHDPLFYRKASIPILLTFAVLPFVAAVVLATTGEDNALPALFPPWTPLALLSISAICLTLAVLNMLATRNAK